jgi:hypothetical protein
MQRTLLKFRASVVQRMNMGLVAAYASRSIAGDDVLIWLVPKN